MANIPLTTVGWICTDAGQMEVATALLDGEKRREKDLETSPAPSATLTSANNTHRGRIGSIDVVVARPGDGLAFVQTVEIEAVIITGCVSDRRPPITHDAHQGDLFIADANAGTDADSARAEAPAKVNTAQRILRREVGEDASWLSSNFSQGGSGSLHYLRDFKEMQCIASSDVVDLCRTLCSLQIPTVVVLAVANGQPGVVSSTGTTLASQNVASYAFELIRLMTDASVMEIQLLYHTENIVPPRPDPQLPPFPIHHFPTYGNTVLLGIPTENEHKTTLLHDFLVERAPEGVKVHVVTVPVESGVGEQPYNEAGVAGAYNRISNALNHLHGAEFVETFKEKLIGTVMVASIESYIQTEDIDRPADFGIVVVHNATTQQTKACCSRGTTLPPEYVRRAQRFGSDGDPNHGNVTVGQILAARVPGLDKADWQAVLGGRSRYELLGEATRGLTIPW